MIKSEIFQISRRAVVRHGSMVAWQHINLHGEYDFSDDKLQDSVGLRLPKNLVLKALENREEEMAATAAN